MRTHIVAVLAMFVLLPACTAYQAVRPAVQNLVDAQCEKIEDTDKQAACLAARKAASEAIDKRSEQ